MSEKEINGNPKSNKKNYEILSGDCKNCDVRFKVIALGNSSK